MTDLWDEKPVLKYHRDEDMFGNPIRVPDYEIYAQEMDAWLKKVKEYWNNTMELNRKQFHEIGRLEKELRSSEKKEVQS